MGCRAPRGRSHDEAANERMSAEYRRCSKHFGLDAGTNDNEQMLGVATPGRVKVFQIDSVLVLGGILRLGNI